MKAVTLAAAGLLLAAPVSAQSLGEKTGVNSLTGTSPTTADFVTEAANSDMFEIQSSELALQKSNGATKDFASKMVADHTKVSAELKKMVADGEVKATIPTTLDSSHQSKLDKLKGLSGNDFDKQYHSDQDSGHKDAVSLYQRYSQGGENAKLKSWAATTLPTLQTHLKMAQDLDK
jgi:putative membrane protein